ncbi:hemerythrin domain-containing protein [Tahibacter amnicola]|uniref:Hemerythrin domain-containing protein n=1 Tax=Tahibacter amnicola TaxID=2976241 RepID=A0ABY6BEP7_9GAMM|nr:hemerythrin domain-containing protein [Tahibacter amnicola]UXI68508.1 hemerythrin domain-containing protein [Tahibacter amnicola]
MIGLLRRVFGFDSRPTVAPPPLVPGVVQAPRYDSALVGQLKGDHQDLVQLFQNIGRLTELNRWSDIPAQLIGFKSRLEAHLLAENVRFYNYVEYTLRDDSENLGLIRDFRREMNSIARGVIDFVKKYQSGTFDQRAREAFLADYRSVGALLVQRIEREEESLYPLYQAS